MPRPKNDPHLYELAKRGAEARLQDLMHEARLLIGLFPHLRDSFDKDELPVAFILKQGANKSARQARTPWTPAQRKAVSRRMKKYWAARKASGKA